MRLFVSLVTLALPPLDHWSLPSTHRQPLDLRQISLHPSGRVFTCYRSVIISFHRKFWMLVNWHFIQLGAVSAIDFRTHPPIHHTLTPHSHRPLHVIAFLELYRSDVARWTTDVIKIPGTNSIARYEIRNQPDSDDICNVAFPWGRTYVAREKGRNFDFNPFLRQQILVNSSC